MWLLLLVAFCFDDTAILVLKDGRKMKLEEGYKVEGNLVVFKNKAGQLLQLPIGRVDLPATEDATRGYQQKRQALLNYKPPEPKKEKLPDEIYEGRETERQDRDKVYDFSSFGEKSFADEKDYFELESAWKLYNRGLVVLENHFTPQAEKQRLKAMLAAFSKEIWECKSTEKRRGDVDELTWEGYKRSRKIDLDKVKDRTAEIVEELEKRLGPHLKK